MSITLDNNNDVLAEIYTFISLYTLPHTSVGLTAYISIVFFFSFDIIWGLSYLLFKMEVRRFEYGGLEVFLLQYSPPVKKTIAS